MSLTLAQALAIAVLKDDMVAAYALVDQLIEERDKNPYEVTKENYENNPVESYNVWTWPEFKSLCKRLGIMWGCRTTDLVIHLPLGGLVEVTQRYQGFDQLGIPIQGEESNE